MDFTEAISSVFKNYATFEGRAVRSEYWYWVLFAFSVVIVANILDVITGETGIFHLVLSLPVLLLGIAVGVRRLHDLDKSGWNLLWGLIPILGAIYLLYLFVQPGTPGSNAYGAAGN